MVNSKYFNETFEFSNYIGNLNKDYLLLLSINVRSVSSIDKFNKFKSLIASLSVLPDIIAVQETWFRSDLTQLYGIPGYCCIHCCRGDSYGGTSIYVKYEWKYSVEVCKSEGFVEYICIKLKNFKVDNKPLNIFSFYRSQKCSVVNFLNIFHNNISNFARDPIIVVGDSNIDLFHNPHYSELLSTFNNYDCDSAHTFVTRPNTGTCIDQVFSNYSDRIFVDSVKCDLSDHNLIACRLGVMNKRPISQNVDIRKTHHDYEKASEVLQNILPDANNSSCASDVLNEFLCCMKIAIECSTSTTTSSEKLRFHLTPWINLNLQKLIEYKDELLRKRRRSRHKDILEKSLKRISKVVNIAKRICMDYFYVDNLQKTGGNMRKSWNFINTTLGRKKKTNIVLKDSQGQDFVSDQSKANHLNSYFIQSVENLRQSIQIQPSDHYNGLRTLTHSQCRFTINSIQDTDVQEVITAMKINKSPGCDGITPTYVKRCSGEITPILVDIFNKMLYECEYPDALKMHKVVAIPKEPSATSSNMYRPIAILSAIDKIFEKILFDKLQCYFDNNNLLYDYQFGFRKGCGTQEAILNVLKCVYKGLDDGYCGVTGVFFDFTKAFDLVDHNIMLQKLVHYGIQGHELLLFKSYFSHRKQYVEINGSKSQIGNVVCGVPQGSGLGPLLFSIYINDLNHLGFFGSLFMFADDVSLFYPYKYDEVLKTHIEKDASLLFEYARLNRLCLNPDKTKLIRFRPNSASLNNNFSVYIDGKLTMESHSIKYLGVILQSNLSWDLHIQSVKRKVAPAIGILFKLKNKLDVRTKLVIYQSLIHSHFSYMAVAYAHNKNSNSLRSLQRLQNKALKIVYNLPIRHSTVALFRDVCSDILPLAGLNQYQILIYVFKCINNIGHHKISFLQNQSNFNTRNRTNIGIPLCRLEKTKQRIDYVGAIAFNNLPANLKSVQQIGTFKSLCKEYILNDVESLLA